MGVGAGLYRCDVVVKSSRSLSHLLMNSCLSFFSNKHDFDRSPQIYVAKTIFAGKNYLCHNSFSMEKLFFNNRQNLPTLKSINIDDSTRCQLICIASTFTSIVPSIFRWMPLPSKWPIKRFVCFSGCWCGCWAGWVKRWWRVSVWRQNRVPITSVASCWFPGSNTAWTQWV